MNMSTSCYLNSDLQGAYETPLWVRAEGYYNCENPSLLRYAANLPFISHKRQGLRAFFGSLMRRSAAA